MASRGDALTPYLLAALERRYGAIEVVDAELTVWQRYLTAAVTYRPNRSRWIERFYKSEFAVELRSRNAARGIRKLAARPDAVVQVHALFSVPHAPSVIYIDCTHAQSAAQWPPWNPLTGRALASWFRRERATYSAARHLFTFSEATRQSLINDYDVDPARVTVAGAGVNFTNLPFLPESDDPRESDSSTILFIGNDFVRKGGPALLEAFAIVRQAIPEARLQLVGAEVAADSQPGVEVLGRIDDRHRIQELYAGATVFAMPSIFEPFGLVAVEAMSFGIPVVTTRQMATPEIIQDGVTGLLVEPGDVQGLAAALIEMLRNPDAAARLGAAGRRDVMSRFTWDAVVDRMAPVLNRLQTSADR
jgi:starch synthase